ncbi:hypothetical protein Aperf_G00000076558 [Anoplocephala perfoliata]
MLRLFVIILSFCGLPLFFIYRYLHRKPSDLSKDIILITGAAHGIGRLLTLLLSRYCPNIIVIDKDFEGLKMTSRLAQEQSGVSLICYKCDLRYDTFLLYFFPSDRDAIRVCAREICAKNGRISLLVSNAGIVNGNYLLDVPSSKVEEVIKVNLMASFYLMKAFLPGMLGRDYENTLERIPVNLRVDLSEDVSELCFPDAEPRGHLVFISSLASQTIGTAVGDYCASKTGMSALVECLRLELNALGVSKQIFVTDIRPYVTDTGMFEGFNSKLPILPILKPEYVAERTVEAIRYRERIVYIPWIIWFIPLVQRIFPFWFLVFLYKISGAFDGMNTFIRANRKRC